MAESDRSELEEKFAHLPAKSQLVQGSVFESVPAESVAHDGANRRLSGDDGRGCADGVVFGRSSSVKGFARSAQKSGSIAIAMEKRKSIVDANSDCWEKAPGTQEVIHSARGSRSDLGEFFTGEEVKDGPGQYKVLSQVTVCETCEESSVQIGVVGDGAVIQVVELVANNEVQHLRARITSPAGWISLADLASGERWAEKVDATAGPITELPTSADVHVPAASSEGSGDGSALTNLGSSLATAASLSSPTADPPITVAHEGAHDPFQEVDRAPHDPFEEFDSAQKVAGSWVIPPTSARQPDSEAGIQQQQGLKKLGDFARSTSRSFLDWTTKAVDKLDGAPEKLQGWKQRTTASFDRAGERLDGFVTCIDGNLDSRAQDWTEKRIPRLIDTSERVAGGVRSLLADKSKRLSQNVREAMEDAAGECQASTSLVNLQGERTGDEMTDAYFGFARG